MNKRGTVGLYEKLLKQRSEGKSIDIRDLTPDMLRKLWLEEHVIDSMIASLYGVEKSRITYLRKKWGISAWGRALNDMLSDTSEKGKALNQKAKDSLMRPENISRIAKAVTHFAFRNGPVEDMHASPNNQLSDEDMKTLNRFMVNRLVYIFTLMVEDRWLEFNLLIEKTDQDFGRDWDDAQPDDGGTRQWISEEIRWLKREEQKTFGSKRKHGRCL